MVEPRDTGDSESLEQRLASLLDGGGDESDKLAEDSGNPVTGCGCSVLFSCAFLLVGTAIFLVYTVSSVVSWLNAAHWPAAECEILHSGLVMEYRYTWEGRVYISRQYDFSSGYTHTSEKESGMYIKGMTASCFVNPDAPGEAILSKSFSLSYLRGVIGLPFALAGLLMVVKLAVPELVRLVRWIRGDDASHFGAG